MPAQSARGKCPEAGDANFSRLRFLNSKEPRARPDWPASAESAKIWASDMRA